MRFINREAAVLAAALIGLPPATALRSLSSVALSSEQARAILSDDAVELTTRFHSDFCLMQRYPLLTACETFRQSRTENGAYHNPFRWGVVTPALGDHFQLCSTWKLSAVAGATRYPIHAASALPVSGCRPAWRTVSPQLPGHPRPRRILLQ
jgi:hypothetical protein